MEVVLGKDLQISAIRLHAIQSCLNSRSNRQKRGVGAIRLTAGNTNAFGDRLKNLSNHLELIGVLDSVISRHWGIGEIDRHFTGLELLEGVGILLGHNNIDGCFPGSRAGLGQAFAGIVTGARQIIGFGRATFGCSRLAAQIHGRIDILRVAFGSHHGLSSFEVRDLADLLGAVSGNIHGRNDDIAFPAGDGRNDGVEHAVDILDFQAQAVGNLIADLDIQALGIAICIEEFLGRVWEIGADQQVPFA